MYKLLKKFFILAASIFVLSACLSAPANAAFSDIMQKSKYYGAVQFLLEKRAETGDKFNPQEFLTKEIFAKWLLSSSNFDATTYHIKAQKRFVDVPETSLYAPYIYKLADLGAIAVPKNRKFYPQRYIKLKEALRITLFTKGIPAPKTFPEDEWKFPYLNINADYAPYLHKAAKLNLLSTERRIFPALPLKRGEAALILKRLADAEITGILGAVTITIDSSALDGALGQNEKFPILKDAYERVLRSYLHRDQLDNNELLFGALSGLVKTLGDKHSEFTKPSEKSVLNTLSGEIEGIGAVIQATEDNKIIIVSPIKKSPAEAAGLLPHDIILEVNREKITGLSATRAADKIRGKAGTEVLLQIQRGSDVFEVTIVRAKIYVPSAEISFTDDNIALITVNNFGGNLNIEFMKAVAEIHKKQPKGIILDLRNNPGGFLDTSIVIAGYFIEQGKVVAKVRYPDRIDEQISQGSGVLKKYPTMVLINKGSASASEILAGALQDYEIAKIIGEKSFGKGTVQELTSYTDGSTLKITVAEWLTPEERLIEGTGITPDIEVVRSEEEIKSGIDPQISRALMELRK